MMHLKSMSFLNTKEKAHTVIYFEKAIFIEIQIK